jgi:hypothetical protein
MTDPDRKRHQIRIMFAMAIYVAVLLAVWPLAKSAAVVWHKAAYALAPVPPILYVIWLMARRVLASDELEQRTHLIGLGVAAGVASVFGIVSGFLAAANVLGPNAAAVALIWVFPLMLIAYSLGQMLAARRYGTSPCIDEGLPLALRFLFVVVVFAALAAYLYYRKGNLDGAATALGMAVGTGVCALGFTIWRHRRRRLPQQ